ncbi:hypothetical protein LIER_09201 [Lithospermum erythrorhizon]|uniref:Uncharacterized protein n=1 Tax=Lithospermum erythrorhizon TaxID=34254 RepID=A0AAV3PFV8_LITER
MASRRRIPSAYEGRSVQDSIETRVGQLLAGHASSEVLENKLAHQAAEINGLAGDNKKLAASHVALKQDLVAAQLEIQKRKEDIRSIRVESDMHIRGLLDRISKFGPDIRAGEGIKRELQEAENEARSLIAANRDLASQIQSASQELEKALTDTKKLPEMTADLESLRQEHQRLRKTFESEKGANMEKVEKMQIMEKDLVDLANEVEKLRDKVLNAERQANAPNLPNGYITQDPCYPPSLHGGMSYLDQNIQPYYNHGAEAPGERRVELGNSISAIVPGAGSSSREGPYDTMHVGR